MAPPKNGPMYTSRTFSTAPINKPPIMAPGIEENTPMISTGSAYNAR